MANLFLEALRDSGQKTSMGLFNAFFCELKPGPNAFFFSRFVFWLCVFSLLVMVNLKAATTENPPPNPKNPAPEARNSA